MNIKTKKNKFFSNGFIIAGILFILAYFFYKENNITIEDLKHMDIDQLRKIRRLKREYCERKKAEGVVQPEINFKEVKGKFDLYRKKTDKEKMRENFVDPKVAGY